MQRWIIAMVVLLVGCAVVEDVDTVEIAPEVQAPVPEPPTKLLTLDLIPIDSFPLPGSTFDFSVRLTNKGTVTNYPLFVTYDFIHRESGEVVTSKKETFAMENLVSKRVGLIVPQSAKAGSYTVMANVSYDNTVAVSSFDVEVQELPERVKQEVQERTTHLIEIRSMKYLPADLNISVGDAVLWANRDEVSHTATGAGFDSGSIRKGDQFLFVFNRSGIYPYSDTFHRSIRGTIVVG